MKNQVSIIGRIGNEIEVKDISETNKAVNFSVAIDDSYRNAQGEKVEQTVWISAVAYGKTAELIGKHFDKGDQLGFIGKLKSRSYETESGKNYVTEVVVENIEFSASKTKSKED